MSYAEELKQMEIDLEIARYQVKRAIVQLNSVIDGIAVSRNSAFIVIDSVQAQLQAYLDSVCPSS